MELHGEQGASVIAELAAHLADTSDAHDASAISIADAGNDFTATDVEGALAELQSDIEGLAASTALSDHLADTEDAHDASAISVADAGTNFAGEDVEAVLTELADADSALAVIVGDHIGDATDAHDASAISLLDTANDFTATNVEDALAELQSDFEALSGGTGLSDHLADATDAHDASAISILDAAGDFTAVNVEDALAELQADAEADDAQLAAHLGDTSDAHDASAVSVVPFSTIAASNVQAALEEIFAEGGGGGGGSGTDMSRSIAQTAHGLAVGDVVRLDGADYIEAQADSSTNAEVVGIVTAVTDANNFTLCFGGYITGLSSLTAGTVYFLSPSSAGALTATAPSTVGEISKPIFIATSTTAGYFFNFRGAEIADGGGGGGDLAAHLADTSDAHDASAISLLDTAADFTATDVEGALAELQAADEADEAALAAHIGDTSDAHDASAISVDDAAGHYAGAEVEAVLLELAPDRTWNAVVRKPSDETITSSTTLQDDDHLQFAADGSAPYYFEAVIAYQSGGTEDIKHAFAVSTGSFSRGWRTHDGLGSTTAIAQTGLVADMTTAIVNAGVTEVLVVRLTGYFYLSTAATVKFQWAQNASGGNNTTVKAGSFIRYRKMV